MLPPAPALGSGASKQPQPAVVRDLERTLRRAASPGAGAAGGEQVPTVVADDQPALAGALPLAEAEPGTVDWYAARTSPTTFWIFDTFGSEDARQAHINGEIAAALMPKADELLATPPEILAADVLARK